MKFYSKLIVSLAVTAGVAAGLLAYTFAATAPVIAEREIADRKAALENVFFLQKGKDGSFGLIAKPLADGVTALYLPGNDKQPAYFAVPGRATGYNSSVPVTLMIGFTGPAQDAASLLKGYVPENKLPAAGEKGEYIVGFSVINSEETPGLGEKVKDSRAPYTWGQAFAGSIPPPNPDHATDFQRQFRGRAAESLALKKYGGDLDAITASTITSNGVVNAMKNAGATLRKVLAEGK